MLSRFAVQWISDDDSTQLIHRLHHEMPLCVSGSAVRLFFMDRHWNNYPLQQRETGLKIGDMKAEFLEFHVMLCLSQFEVACGPVCWDKLTFCSASWFFIKFLIVFSLMAVVMMSLATLPNFLNLSIPTGSPSYVALACSSYTHEGKDLKSVQKL